MPTPGRVERRSFNHLPQSVRKDLVAAMAGRHGAPRVASPDVENKAFCFGGLAAVIVAVGCLLTGQVLLFALALACGLWLLISWDSGRRGILRDPLVSGTYLFANDLLIVSGPDLVVVPCGLITRHDFRTDGCAMTVFFDGGDAVLRAPVAEDLHNALTHIAHVRTLGPQPDLEDLMELVVNCRRIDDGLAPRWTAPYPLLGMPTPVRLGVVAVIATGILAAVAVPFCPVMVSLGSIKAPDVAVTDDEDANDIDELIANDDMPGINGFLHKKVPSPDVLKRIDACCKAHYAKALADYRKKSGNADAADFVYAYYTWAGTHRAQPILVHFVGGTITAPTVTNRNVQTGPAFSEGDLGRFQSKVYTSMANSIASGTDGEIHLEVGKPADSLDDDITVPCIFAEVSVAPSGDIYVEVPRTRPNPNMPVFNRPAEFVGVKYIISVRLDAPGHSVVSIDETLNPPKSFMARSSNPTYGGPGGMGQGGGGVNSGDVDDGMFEKGLGHFGITVTTAFNGH